MQPEVEQALSVIVTVCASHTGNLQEHQIIQGALETVKGEVTRADLLQQAIAGGAQADPPPQDLVVMDESELQAPGKATPAKS